MKGGKREGAGRKPLFTDSVSITAKVKREYLDTIPSPRAEWIREAIRQRLERDGLIEKNAEIFEVK